MEKINWKITLAYDGTDFHGWQVQRDHMAAPTVQGTLSDAIHAVTGERVLPQGSGRTDAGVHAAAQVASFPLAATIPAQNLQRALNRVLPAAIRIMAAQPVPPDFHARHSATGKVYRYRIFDGPACSPFLARFAACSRWPLDLDAMQTAAQTVLGEHDFTSFAALDPDRTHRLNGSASTPNIRRVDRSQWSCDPLPSASTNPFAEHGAAEADCTARIFTYTVAGNGFLHHMVRNLVGTFVEAGRGRLSANAIPGILNAGNRALAGPTAPAQGLCLLKVLYE